MAVAVAGGDGELGFHIVQMLRQAGCSDIRCIGLRKFGEDWCPSHVCDIAAAEGTTDREILRGALTGCSGVICALMPPLMTAPREAFFRSNVDAVGVLLEESERLHVKSFVHISSIAVMNHFVDHVNVDESLPAPDQSQYSSPYDLTKRLGENKVLAVRNDDMWTVSLRCGGIISSHRAPQFMGLFEKTGILLWAGKPIDTTHGVNIAWATHLALRALHSRAAHVNREVFYVTGHPLNQLDVAVHVTSRLGNKYKILPSFLVHMILAGMWLAHTVKRLCGRLFGCSVPGIGLHTFVQMGKYSQTFSNDKARTILNYTPLLSTDQAFDRIVAEYRSSINSAPA